MTQLLLNKNDPARNYYPLPKNYQTKIIAAPQPQSDPITNISKIIQNQK